MCLCLDAMDHRYDIKLNNDAHVHMVSVADMY
jgi:hypothetical protein